MRSIRRSIRSIGNPFRRVSTNGNGRSKKAWLCFVTRHYEDSYDSEAEVIDSSPSVLPDQDFGHASPPPPPPPPYPPPPPPRQPNLVRSPENGNEYPPLPRESRAILIEETGESENEWPVRGPPPAPDTVINSIPILKISESYKRDKFDCSVCLDEFKVGEEAKQLPCNHIYHPHCIVIWLSRHNSCPVCRHKLLESQIALKTDIEDSGYETTREELDDESQILFPLPPLPSPPRVSAWEYFFPHIEIGAIAGVELDDEERLYG